MRQQKRVMKGGYPMQAGIANWRCMLVLGELACSAAGAVTVQGRSWWRDAKHRQCENMSWLDVWKNIHTRISVLKRLGCCVENV
jgi:hypothetical protein